MRIKEITFDDNAVALVTEGIEIARNGARVVEEKTVEVDTEEKAKRSDRNSELYDIIRPNKSER